MFTGIIREIGVVTQVERRKGLARLAVLAPKTASAVEPLESVAVNGVCLSAVTVRRGTMTFEVIRETQQMTTLGALRSGDRVHLEPSLSFGDRLSGHLLFGHVDGVGIIVRRRQLPGELQLEIRTTPRLRQWLVPKGPVAVDGISLTVGKTLGRSTFTVHLIPETMRHTMLASKGIRDRVNLEVDYIAKLVRQFVSLSNSKAD